MSIIQYIDTKRKQTPPKKKFKKKPEKNYPTIKVNIRTQITIEFVLIVQTPKNHCIKKNQYFIIQDD